MEGVGLVKILQRREARRSQPGELRGKNWGVGSS